MNEHVSERLRSLWLAIGCGFVVLVIYLSLTPDPPDVPARGGLKTGHLIAYAWLMLWFAQTIRRGRIWLALSLCGLGIALEYVQGMTDYRGFEYSDMLINSSGVALGWLLAQTPLQNVLRALEAALRLQ
jgi:hypothetical protein